MTLESPFSILVVEDDDRLAHMMATSLKKAGYEAQIETNGTAAVERIRRDSPDLVVLDIMLPGADGFTVCKKVREFYDNPILMVTALGSDDEHIFWKRTLERTEKQDGDLEKALEILNAREALSDTLIRARGYADTARAALTELPENEYRTALENVVDFCLERAY